MARRFLGTGVIGGYLGQLAVTASGAALSVSVATGDAFVEGFFYRNDSALALTIATANATNPRLDTVVVRLDRTANTATLAVVTGTPAASPVAPTLNATDALFDLPLANVTVPAAAGVIVAANVTDRRSFSGPASPATITASGAAVVPLVVKGATGQTGNLFEMRDAAGALLVRTFASGTLATAQRLVAGDSTGAVIGGAPALAAVTVGAGSVGLVVRGLAGQTANLAEFQNSAGTVLTGVTGGGRQIVNTFVNAATTATAGANSAPPAAVAGYLLVFDANGGVNRKIPYYND